MSRPPFSLSGELSVKLELRVPSNVDIPRLIEWLTLLNFGLPSEVKLANADSTEKYLLLGVSFLRGVLLAGNIPDFDRPRIVSTGLVEGSGDRVSVNMILAVTEGVAISIYKNSLLKSFEIMLTLQHLEPNRLNVECIFEKVMNDLISPLRRLIPAGQSTMHVLRAAHAQDIPFVHLGLGVFQLGWGSKARLIDRSTIDRDSAMGARLSHDKAATAAVLKHAGLPHPKHIVVMSADELEPVARQIGFPLVVKPSDQECGVGVSVDINDQSALEAAFELARNNSRSGRVLVEQQVAGVCHRIFIANGQLLYAVKRDPVTIHGDGKRSISQIVSDAHNFEGGRPPWLRKIVPTIDDEVIAVLRRRGLTPDSIPADGAAIQLRRIESTALGGFDEDVTLRMHPDNVAIALNAARLFKLANVGVDIITTNIALPWHQNGAIINELNFAPLLGGADISRSYIPHYLNDLMGGNGKIPIESYTIQAVWLNRYQQHTQNGLRCFTVTLEGVLNDRLQVEPMAQGTLKQRVQALLLRSDVDAILVCTDASIMV